MQYSFQFRGTLSQAITLLASLQHDGELTLQGELLEVPKRTEPRVMDYCPEYFYQLDEVLKDELRNLMDQGKKIEAIKLLRSKVNLGLKESKDMLEASFPPKRSTLQVLVQQRLKG